MAAKEEEHSIVKEDTQHVDQLSEGDGPHLPLDHVSIGRENWHAQRADWRQRPPHVTPTDYIEKFKKSKACDLELIQFEIVSGRKSGHVPLQFVIASLVDCWEEETF
ncbi:MAG: hypothetical protein Q8P67_10755 [archaeon]|nr:hypothetical protein [archaeon]